MTTETTKVSEVATKPVGKLKSAPSYHIRVGSIVHYVEPRYGNHRAAIVTKIVKDGVVDLVVFKPFAESPDSISLGNIPLNMEGSVQDLRVGTWHPAEWEPVSTKIPNATGDSRNE